MVTLSHDSHVIYVRIHTPCRQGEGEGKYVQDGMRKYGLELAQWVMEEQAYIFVCG